MEGIQLTTTQQEAIDYPLNSSIFLEGPAGSGKTTSALARLNKILDGIRGDQLLILVPQLSLGIPYKTQIDQTRLLRGGRPAILTIGGLARRLTELFWPLFSRDAGFTNPIGQPQFLSTETAQYCMEKVVAPLLEKGFFRSVSIEKNRLFGQLLDDLNKSAVVGIPMAELSGRLKNTTLITPELSIAYDQMQTCVQEFRHLCFQNNLLDYSLLIEFFVRHLWPSQLVQDYFFRTWKVLIAENTEEDVPVAHDLLKQWIPRMEASVTLFDHDAGYRQFLGADPVSAFSVGEVCRQKIHFQRLGSNANIQRLKVELISCINHKKSQAESLNLSPTLDIRDFHFYPEMIQSISREIGATINYENIPPDQIVILSPYLSDALNFSLEVNLAEMHVPVISSRPSRKYLAEPAVRAMLAFARLAHPRWGLPVTSQELRGALMTTIPNLDIVRADLAVRTLFSARHPEQGLRSFDELANRSMQERITFLVGEKLQAIRDWIEAYKAQTPQPLDVFLSMFFGELLSQTNFSFNSDYQAAESIAKVILSMRSFRLFSQEFLEIDEISSGFEYLRAIEGGLLPAAIQSRQKPKLSAVQVSPAHTFLMENRQVAIQYWLDIGAMGWWERLNQPLTNPYLLNRNFDSSQRWTEAHEFNANQDAMQRVVAGLLNRCTNRIIVSAVRTNEFGSESRGPLLHAFQTLQKRIYLSSEASGV
jgi:hypothetical protein